jgi:predicted phage terminase large subunit-like protein
MWDQAISTGLMGAKNKPQEIKDYESSLAAFTLGAWTVLEPGTPYVHNWHIDCICEHLEAVFLGHIPRLIINQPPRTLKSTLVTKIWPCWCWAKQPTLRLMFTSYSSGLSEDHSVDRRQLLTSSWYRALWPDVQLSRDSNVKVQYSNTQRGMMIATSVGGTSTGKGGDINIFDDPLSADQASSNAEREHTNAWIRSSFLTRVNDERTARFVGVMQRLHERDTTGIFLDDPSWTILCLEAESEKRKIISFPISGRQVIREEGDLLFPERLPPKVLAQKKLDLGSYGYSGQFQQRPSPAEGGLFKRHWWRFWYPQGTLPPPVVCKLEDNSTITCHQEPLPGALVDGAISVDCTLKDIATSDFVVAQVWACHLSNKYLLDQRRGRMDAQRTMDAIHELLLLYPQSFTVLIEDKANGPAIIKALSQAIMGVIPVNPEGGKESRANAVAPSVESGNIYLPHPACFPWVHDFIEELAGFPTAAHDDMCDAFSQMLNRYQSYQFRPRYPIVSPARPELAEHAKRLFR